MLLLALTPTRAEVLHPKLPCRVFVDTDYTQIPGQCGTVWRSYAPKLFTLTTRVLQDAEGAVGLRHTIVP